MAHRNAAYNLIPLAVLRRLILARLGFRTGQAGHWQRGAIVITDERLDAMTPRAFAARVRAWRRQGRPDGEPWENSPKVSRKGMR
jgi:hypothetical protein